MQQECRSLSEADAPEINPLLQQAAAALRERPVLFKYCAEEVAQARHTALFQRFIKVSACLSVYFWSHTRTQKKVGVF